jgi:enoyl-CoA hydratase/carnithine racemase
MSVEFAREGAIAIITLNRPEKLNAMTPEMYAEITRRLQEVDGDDDIWVGIITGAGTRAFSAGADLTTPSVARPPAPPPPSPRPRW